jgi:outer membrane protein
MSILKCRGVLALGLLLLLRFDGTGYCAEQEGKKPEKEPLPLYEYGLIGVASTLPDYRGSDETQNYYFPLPYFIYRGEWLKANREGIRGIFWRTERFQTEISLSGNPPVSDDNKAREGMDELDALLEMGPALRYYFWNYGERDTFFLQANVRAAVSAGFDDGVDMRYQGITSGMSLSYHNSRLFRKQKVRFHVNAGLQFSDDKLHSYFYEVDEKYATDTRAAFDAQGGYTGAHLSGSILKEFSSRFWLGAYGRWLNNSGTANEDSPLMREDNNYILGLMAVWKIGESESREK